MSFHFKNMTMQLVELYPERNEATANGPLVAAKRMVIYWNDVLLRIWADSLHIRYISSRNRAGQTL